MKINFDSKTVLGIGKLVCAVGGLLIAYKIEEKNREEDREEIKKEVLHELSEKN